MLEEDVATQELTPGSRDQEGKVYKGTAKPKADVTISLSDETFQQVRRSHYHLF